MKMYLKVSGNHSFTWGINLSSNTFHTWVSYHTIFLECAWRSLQSTPDDIFCVHCDEQMQNRPSLFQYETRLGNKPENFQHKFRKRLWIIVIQNTEDIMQKTELKATVLNFTGIERSCDDIIGLRQALQFHYWIQFGILSWYAGLKPNSVVERNVFQAEIIMTFSFMIVVNVFVHVCLFSRKMSRIFRSCRDVVMRRSPHFPFFWIPMNKFVWIAFIRLPG